MASNVRVERIGLATLYLGDCLEVLRTLPDNSVDSVVTDPPYGLSDHKPADVVACLAAWLAGEEYRPKKKGFMGRAWDSWVPGPEVWREVFRVLKPGGHVVAFAGSRTHDLMSMALRLAGFECRDTIMDLYATSDAAREFVDSLSEGQRKALATALPADIGVLWTYGSGFPKSMDVSKAIDKAAGAEREVVGIDPNSANRKSKSGTAAYGDYADESERLITAPATDAARQWSGWGTALKPAFEPALLFRKPLDGNVAQNVMKHGTGALNIDGCRVATDDDLNGGAYSNGSKDLDDATSYATGVNAGEFVQPTGRWPANLIHDGSDDVVAAFPQAKGQQGDLTGHTKSRGNGTHGGMAPAHDALARIEADTSAARFFYAAKASRADREGGLAGFEVKAIGSLNMRSDAHAERTGELPKPRANTHPTVKPTDLMAYLCRLVTPPGGAVLDPFMGSGSTGKAAIPEGFHFIGVECEPAYFDIACERIYNAYRQNTLFGQDENVQEVPASQTAIEFQQE